MTLLRSVKSRKIKNIIDFKTSKVIAFLEKKLKFFTCKHNIIAYFPPEGEDLIHRRKLFLV